MFPSETKGRVNNLALPLSLFMTQCNSFRIFRFKVSKKSTAIGSFISGFWLCHGFRYCLRNRNIHKYQFFGVDWKEIRGAQIRFLRKSGGLWYNQDDEWKNWMDFYRGDPPEMVNEPWLGVLIFENNQHNFSQLDVCVPGKISRYFEGEVKGKNLQIFIQN